MLAIHSLLLLAAVSLPSVVQASTFDALGSAALDVPDWQLWKQSRDVEAGVRHSRHRRHSRRAATKCKPKSSSGTTATTDSTPKVAKSKPSGKGGKHSCFPYGASFNNATAATAKSRDSWWCSANKMTGFLGFSYPLEVTDCSDVSNSYAQIKRDFQIMKSSYGARFVRIYAPQCRDQSIWTTLSKVGVELDMAVLPMVWWGFDDNADAERKQGQASLLKEIEENPLAPYVFHSVAFGSEPIGDGVDGGIQQFTTDFISFKSQLKDSGIPATVSEDLYRTGSIINNDGTLTSDGQRLMDAMDLVHAHIMPYYASDVSGGAAAWPWVQDKLKWYPTISDGKQIMITEMQWSSGGSWHTRPTGSGEDLGDEQAFWDSVNTHCSVFKSAKIGWFLHTFNDAQEPGFGLLDASNKPKFNFKIKTC